jgi:meiotically up-regulated gene 157 (Mug157) protein
LTPANAMLAVELDHIAEMLEELNVHQNISSKSRDYSKTIRQAVWDHTITSKGIFAYETDGFGGQIIMDDGNVPVRPLYLAVDLSADIQSLLSMPYLGFLDRNESTYLKTKDAMLSAGNPYFAAGSGFSGAG